MEKIRPTREFNTHRPYATDGQVIRWALFKEGQYDLYVVFDDTARGIWGKVMVFFGNEDLLTDAWVLNAYDNYHYENVGWEVVEKLKEVK